MNTETNFDVVTEALELAKPSLREQFTNQVTRTFERIVPTNGKSDYATKQRWYKISHLIRGTKMNDYSNAYLVSELVERAATAYADNQVEFARAKLMQKLCGAVTLTTFTMNTDGVTFYGHGKLVDGTSISIRQQRVLKFTNYGMPFNQFPARLYKDGKPITAAEFRKLIAQ